MVRESTTENGETAERPTEGDGDTSRRTLLKGALGAGSLALTPALAERVAGAGKTAEAEFIDQVSDGTSVVVQELFLPQGGFMSIHDARFIGTGGEVAIGARSILGYSEYLSAGTHTNVKVPLFEDERLNFEPYPDRTLKDIQYLIALPHKDTNNNQQWDFYPNQTNVDQAFVTGNTSEYFPLKRANDGAVIVSGDVTPTLDEVPLATDF